MRRHPLTPCGIELAVEVRVEGGAGVADPGHHPANPSRPAGIPVTPGNPHPRRRVPVPVEDLGAPAPIDADAAFTRYVLPEVEVLYRVARSLTRHDADAEDLVQDTLLRAFRAIGRFDGRHPRAWLVTIMRNAQINRVRRRRPGLLSDPDTVELTASDPDAGPEALVVDQQLDAIVETAYQDLPDKFRGVIDLVDLAGLSYQEAADVLEIPQGTVMSRLHRGRKRIREALADADHPRGARP